ncbi:hypothetical protein [Nesterenkonia halobia]|uniref:Uncharacterized protein n=1 Tax=Nesterenkonia halobia TaxID=37922 RepID=A0ABP6RCI1_9MICC
MLAPLTSRTETLPGVTFEALPDDLPGEGAVSAEAQGLTDHAAGVRAAYDDAASSWSGLSDGRLDVPDGEVVRTALQDTVLPHVEDLEEVTGAVRGALDTFDADIAELAPVIRQAITDGETLNSTPLADRDENFHRLAQLQQEHVLALGARYDEIVQACVDAINGAGGHRKPSAAVGMLGAGVSAGEIGREFAKNFTGAQVTRPYHKNGQLAVGFDSDKFSDESIHKHRGPKLPEFVYRKAGVPQDYLDKFSDAASGDGTRVSNTDTQRMLKSVDGTNTPLGKLVGAVPSLKNSKLSYDGDRLGLHAPLTDGNGMPTPDPGKSPTTAAKAASTLEKVGNSPWSKTLGGFGTVLSGVGNYREEYNESRTERPQATEAEHRAEARVDAGVKTAAETAGATAGAMVGRVAGAAVGQTLIPVPGVGAAVGGFVGGVAGSAVGEYLGGTLADEIDAGLENAHETLNDVTEGVEETLDTLNPFT